MKQQIEIPTNECFVVDLDNKESCEIALDYLRSWPERFNDVVAAIAERWPELGE